MSREFTPRHAQTAGDLGFAVQFNAETMETRWVGVSAELQVIVFI